MTVVDIFAPSSGPRSGPGDFAFYQGIVVAWDAIAGTNTVRVRGSELQDLLSLVGSETGLIRAGDTVCVVRLQSSYAVLGRIETPGVEQRAFGLATQRVAASVSTSSPSFVALPGGPSVQAYIGSSRRCRVEIGSFISSYGGYAYVGFAVSGESSIAAVSSRALGIGSSTATILTETSMSATRVINLSAADGLNEGLNTFTAMYQFLAEPSGGPPEFMDREITVQPF